RLSNIRIATHVSTYPTGKSAQACGMSMHLKGLIITALGVLFVVPDALFVKLIVAEPMVIAFWRGVTVAVFILAFVLVFSGPRSIGVVLSEGWPVWLYMVLIASTAPGFVLAITQTSVANAVFIFASMPVFAALFGWLMLAERIGRRMVLTMAGVFMGLAIIAYGSQQSEIASWRGDIWALYVSAAYALALTAIRKVRGVYMLPAIPIAFLGMAILLFPFIDPLPAFADQWPVFLLHGGFIAVATSLLTLGPRYISAAEVALLILLESVLAPLLVWAVLGEDPGVWALLGGAVVIGVLVISNLLLLRQHRRAQMR
ncbi:MAG: DMT family transporter, partial [Pseudomonadota bacterium]